MKFAFSVLSVVALVAAMTLALVGGPAPAQADQPSNPFEGSWSGTFSAVGFEAVGTIDLTISASGVITGVYHNTTVDIGGTMQGKVTPDGDLGLNPNVYGPGPGGKGGNGEHHAGTAVIGNGGVCTMTTTGVWHGGYTVVATLTKN